MDGGSVFQDYVLWKLRAQGLVCEAHNLSQRAGQDGPIGSVIKHLWEGRELVVDLAHPH